MGETIFEMIFRAVVFDLDGTLLDTLEDIACAANRVLERHGFPSHPIARYRVFVGDGMKVLVHRALPERARDEETVERLVQGMREEYGRHWRDRSRPYEGIPELLNALRRRRMKLAVLSNKPDVLTKRCVAHLLSHWRFEVVRGQIEGGSRKPDPSGAVQIAGSMGVPADAILYLGDTGVDMETAVGAGMYPAGALWGFREREELERAGARVCLGKPGDLISVLNEAG